uniref:Uncharacterized protein n=1 Tax=Hordeum vulgare subsp. vulgare TaxID=112509 RepID=A0A8I7B521_HORVV
MCIMFGLPQSPTCLIPVCGETWSGPLPVEDRVGLPPGSQPYGVHVYRRRNALMLMVCTNGEKFNFHFFYLMQSFDYKTSLATKIFSCFLGTENFLGAKRDNDPPPQVRLLEWIR